MKKENMSRLAGKIMAGIVGANLGLTASMAHIQPL